MQERSFVLLRIDLRLSPNAVLNTQSIRVGAAAAEEEHQVSGGGNERKVFAVRSDLSGPECVSHFSLQGKFS